MKAQIEALRAQVAAKDAEITKLQSRPGQRKPFGLRELIAEVLERPKSTMAELEAFAKEKSPTTIKPSEIKRAFRLGTTFIEIAKATGRWAERDDEVAETKRANRAV
jgi:hypothetical protein